MDVSQTFTRNCREQTCFIPQTVLSHNINNVRDTEKGDKKGNVINKARTCDSTGTIKPVQICAVKMFAAHMHRHKLQWFWLWMCYAGLLAAASKRSCSITNMPITGYPSASQHKILHSQNFTFRPLGLFRQQSGTAVRRLSA